ncbi:MAG: hypothetical protein P4M04_07320 [Acidobacteriota bacterium]|nr:hypothetical protein [Acidobacteriota bacterium]
MLIHLELPHRYEVESLAETSILAGSEVFQYRAAHPGHDDRPNLLLRFRPEGSQPWIGSFSSGSVDPNAPSMVISSPNPLTAFVIAAGDAYSVQVDSPGSFQMLPVSPVLFAEALPQQTVVVLGSANALAVYDPKGLCWFRRVVNDELKLESIARGTIHFSGLDAANGKSVSGSADLDTGKEVA